MKIPRWNSEEFLEIIAQNEMKDYFEQLWDAGFKHRTNFFSSYYTSEQTFLELCEFRNGQGDFIVSLWNYNEELKCFWCKGHKESLECLKLLSDLAKNIILVEKGVFEMEEKNT